MTVAHGVLDSAVSVQVMPLQFGGNFIELAVLFLILALVAAVLGARGIAGLSGSSTMELRGRAPLTYLLHIG